jgi:hypothetical protein
LESQIFLLAFQKISVFPLLFLGFNLTLLKTTGLFLIFTPPPSTNWIYFPFQIGVEVKNQRTERTITTPKRDDSRQSQK